MGQDAPLATEGGAGELLKAGKVLALHPSPLQTHPFLWPLFAPAGYKGWVPAQSQGKNHLAALEGFFFWGGVRGAGSSILQTLTQKTRCALRNKLSVLAGSRLPGAVGMAWIKRESGASSFPLATCTGPELCQAWPKELSAL